MNARNSADIIEAIVADHRVATRRVRERLAEADELARRRAEVAATPDGRRPGTFLRSAKEPAAGDDAPRDDQVQRPARWLS